MRIKWWKVCHDQLHREHMKFLTPVMWDWTHGMILHQNAPQWVLHIVGVSKVITPMQIVPSGVDHHLLKNPYTSSELYNTTYLIAEICWSQQGYLLSIVGTHQYSSLCLVSAIPDLQYVTELYLSVIFSVAGIVRLCQVTSQTHVYHSRDWTRLYQSHTG